MTTKVIRISFSILLVLWMQILSSGCSQKSGGAAQDKESSQSGQQESVPQDMKAIESHIESIIQSLGGPTAEKEQKSQQGQTGQQEQQTQQQEQSQQSDQKGQQQQSGQEKKDQPESANQNQQPGQQEQSGQGAQQTGQKEQKQQDPWEKVTQQVTEIHYNWNSYLPAAVKGGAGKTLIDNFSNALNTLTGIVQTKNKSETLSVANEVFSFIPEFYSLYKEKSTAELKRIKYDTRKIILGSAAGNWDAAAASLTRIKSSWSLFSSALPEDKKEDADKLELSIYELEKVVQQKNQQLTDIKGRIVITNIGALEKEGSSSQGSSGS